MKEDPSVLFRSQLLRVLHDRSTREDGTPMILALLPMLLITDCTSYPHWTRVS